MSLATLKKKTASKYKNNSVNLPQFSINGTHRNQGYIGQTSLERKCIGTPMSGTEAQGHGGCCGKYNQANITQSSVFTTENSTVVKPSVLSTSGMLAKRTRWVRRPQPFSITKPSDSINQSTGGDYILYRRKKELSAVEKANAVCVPQAVHRCKPTVPMSAPPCPLLKVENNVKFLSEGEYLLKLNSTCANLDISYIQYSTNTGVPISTCGK
jgi:hypothetical protein